jgi:hypothetical protein
MSDKKARETVVVSRVRNFTDKPPIPGSRIVTCETCGCSCWQAPATQNIRGTYLCFECLRNRVAAGELENAAFRVLPDTRRELREYQTRTNRRSNN